MNSKTNIASISSPTACAFPAEKPRTPFFLVVSYLEPHFQNDCNCFVAPNGYADRYRNSFVPEDLKFFPGDWASQLPDYYGCIARVDENVGKLRTEIAKREHSENTILAFVSDHGCHFRTRNPEYKRSGHEASIHIPMIMAGPGFNRSLSVKQLVSQIDVAPTLLDACGITPPSSFQGRSALPLLGPHSDKWQNEVFVQISESMTGRRCAHRNGHMSWHNRMESRGLPHPSMRSTSFITYSPIRMSS